MDFVQESVFRFCCSLLSFFPSRILHTYVTSFAKFDHIALNKELRYGKKLMILFLTNLKSLCGTNLLPCFMFEAVSEHL